MPSEVVQKENETITENTVESKKIVEKQVISDTVPIKENNAEENIVINDEPTVTDTKEETESENKENEEPVVEDEETKKKRADELLAAGKRSLALKDYQAAVDVLSEACSLFGTVYGEMAEECAEAYFKYGCALLELSKDQTSPVGIEDKEDDDDEDDEDSSMVQDEGSAEADKSVANGEEDKSVANGKADKPVANGEADNPVANGEADKAVANGEADKPVANGEEKKSVADSKTESGKANGVDKPANEEGNSTLEADKSVTTNDVEDTSMEEIEEKEGKLEDMAVEIEEDIAEEDVNDLQVAWEMLDLAKVIYKKMDTEDAKLKLAEVLMKCGDVSIEDEKFETAIEDMTEALNIRRLLLPEDSRIIAETLFQLGIAQELGGSGERAVELLNEAAAVLDQRIKTLESSDSNNDKVKEEVADIKTVIPEIQERIIDIKERKKAAISALLAAVAGAANGGEIANGGESSAKEASNINHLIRKRPKQSEADGTPNKIPKIEEPEVVQK
ncbi:histone-binding protein N1/N2 [Adelges cooleyi]|uniref:histone-binding protein N1/N2 n=1 Tax=Adelges cooleyi TaxID=133065 RepID=UPI00217FBB90|nr:histone-binding protein N1/N2 [Adelges cooleyi]XP_050433367.1 histone-binding protein N1/N2 [Adelges cooleyi]